MRSFLLTAFTAGLVPLLALAQASDPPGSSDPASSPACCAKSDAPACCQAEGTPACCAKSTKEQCPKADAEDSPASTVTSADTPGDSQTPAQYGMTSDEHSHIQALLLDHTSISRKVEVIPGGVKTINTTSRPELVETLRQHVREMHGHLEKNIPVRLWDPPFAAVFAHAHEIDLKYKDIDNGIEVVETSADPEVAKIIQAHAQKVNSFVAEGHDAARPPWAGGMGKAVGKGMGKGMGKGKGRGFQGGRGQ